jgi:hypothetical protein
MTGIEARVSIPSDVIFHDLNGEAVLLNLQTGKYFGLDSTGTRIWNLLVEFGSPGMAYNVLLEEFDVDAQHLNEDLLAWIDQLVERGLIQLDTPLDDNES